MHYRGVRVLRQDTLHLNVMAAGLTVLSTTGVLSTRVVLSGDLDIATTVAFDLVVDQALEAGPPHLDVDLARLTFLGAAGMTALHRSDDRCRHRGGRLALERAERRIHRLLTVAGLDRLLIADPVDARAHGVVP